MVLIRNIARVMFTLTLLVVTEGCGVKVGYSFSGVSVSPEVKTFSVSTFQNRASLVQPGLSQKLTDALMDMCQAQTNLDMVTSGGDVSFEGDITDYRTQPLTVSGDEQAASNRFSISVRVRFVNTVDTDLSYEQTFTRYQDYDSALDLSAVEVELADEISKMLIEDIFNKAFVNW